MYIRIQNNAIRYRISIEEANQLIDGKNLSDSLSLSQNQNLTYSISVTENMSSFSFIASDNNFQMQVNKIQLLNELDIRPSKSGIIIEKDKDNGRDVYLEIDIKKVKSSKM